MMVMNAQMEPVLATIRAQKGGDRTTSPRGSLIWNQLKFINTAHTTFNEKILLQKTI